MSESDVGALCIACLLVERYWPSYLCGGCFARLCGDLAIVAWVHGLLGDNMRALGTAWKPGTIHRGGGSRPPFDVQLHDVRQDIEATLTRFADRTAQQHQPAVPGPRQWDVRSLAKWMRYYTPWISDQVWADELVTKLAELRRAANPLAPWQLARSDKPLPCPKCGWLSLALYTGSDGIVCRNRLCGAPMTWADYQRQVTESYDRYLRELAEQELEADAAPA